MEIKLKLSNNEHKDLLSYCNLNDLLISEVVKKSFMTGFNIERYGLLNTGGTEEKQVEKEVIVEKRVEIPVEVIKEVVKIEYVEVPVEVIKEVVKIEYVEVPVEKIIEVDKEVIKYVEVPVEKVIIKEVIKEVVLEKPVTKVEYVSDDTEITKLLLRIEELENKPPEIIEIIKEIIREVEVPVEVIKEIIKEVEVPVEVVKEIIIEKESDGNWKPKLEALQNTVQKLKQDNIEKDKKIREQEQTIVDIQKFQQDKKAVFLKGSNLGDTLYK